MRVELAILTVRGFNLGHVATGWQFARTAATLAVVENMDYGEILLRMEREYVLKARLLGDLQAEVDGLESAIDALRRLTQADENDLASQASHVSVQRWEVAATDDEGVQARIVIAHRTVQRQTSHASPGETFAEDGAPSGPTTAEPARPSDGSPVVAMSSAAAAHGVSHEPVDIDAGRLMALVRGYFMERPGRRFSVRRVREALAETHALSLDDAQVRSAMHEVARLDNRLYQPSRKAWLYRVMTDEDQGPLSPPSHDGSLADDD